MTALESAASELVTLAGRIAELARVAGSGGSGSSGEGGNEPIPAGAKTCIIGEHAFPYAGTNPTADSNPAGAGFAGARGEGQLVGYAAPYRFEPTNQWGAAVTVVGGIVTGRVDRQKAWQETGVDPGPLPVPERGCVLSGHDEARAWLLEHATSGARVSWSTVPVPEPPAPLVAAGPVLASYLMDGQGGVPALSPHCTQTRVAFVRLTGGSLQPVEWGGETPAETQARLGEWVRARTPAGRRRTVLLSFGGQHGGTTFGDPARFDEGYAALAPKYSASGLDIDLEGGALDIPAAVQVVRECAAVHTGPDPFVASFVPPGGPPVERYLEAARRCQAAGILVQFGQQLYDAVVTQAQAIDQTRLAVNVLGQASVLVGFMIGSTVKYWTVDQAVNNVAAIKAKWPGIGGVYAWEANRPGTSVALARMAALWD